MKLKSLLRKRHIVQRAKGAIRVNNGIQGSAMCANGQRCESKVVQFVSVSVGHGGHGGS